MMREIIKRLSSKQKTAIVIAYDTALVALTFIFSFQLRLNEFFIDSNTFAKVANQLIIILPVQVFSFYFLGLYKGIWRYSSTADLTRIVKGVSLAIPVSFLSLYLFNRFEFIPRSIFFIQWALLIIGVGGGRFAYRLYRDSLLERVNKHKKRTKRTIIIGAGYASQLLIRDIKGDIGSDINIVGLLDDDISKRGKILHGFKVLGAISDVSQCVEKYKITDAILTIPSASKEELSQIVKYLEGTTLNVKSIPKLGDIISGKLQISKLRKITLSDLLGREQVELNLKSMGAMISDKTILITGAGGSIGSELCVQIAKFNPRKIVCVEISELNLYQLTYKLEKLDILPPTEYLIADIRDAETMTDIFKRNNPEIIFHAAAYKHVPLMELNPMEAIKVNILGTQNIVQLADKFRVSKFVLVSTDKAVNPTNVMGATKRVAELICAHQQERSQTKYEVVRFGNVLGSSGSVIPKFQKQIENGGPLTVTHPDIIRYFMSIPEAAQLVIQAGAMGKGGEIFILDMGDPVKIVDLAKQMITLAGLKLNEDIEIEFTGLRPGEKLFEELLCDKEKTLPTAHDRVRVAKAVNSKTKNFSMLILQLISPNEDECIRTKLQRLVPEYTFPEEFKNHNNLSFSNKQLN